MIDAYIGLGSNLGDSPAQLRRALEELALLPDLRLSAVSSVFRTEPQGRKDQPWFSNMAVRLLCSEVWTPQSLLRELLALETRMGRTRDPRDHFGPRVIDIDLLLFGSETAHILEEPALELPHPRLHERAFVLVPLHEIAPRLILPDGRAVCALLAALPHRVEQDRIYQ